MTNNHIHLRIYRMNLFYNKFEKEILDHWFNELEGMTNWVANRIIAWDNQNKFVHYDDGEIYIKQYGILFKYLPIKMTKELNTILYVY